MYLANFGRRTSFFVLAMACFSIGVPGDSAQPAKDVKERKTYGVLLVDGKPVAEKTERATYFLGHALTPYGDKPSPDGTKIRTKVISPAQFADLTAEEMKALDCMFLCDVPRFSKAQAQKLEAFVRGGGGIVMCLGPQVDMEAYNKELHRGGKGLLPTKLLETRAAKKDRDFHLTASANSFKQPPLSEAFEPDGTRELRLGFSQFHKFVRVEEPTPQSKVRVIASFADPKDKHAGIALLEWLPFADGKGKGGRVILVTTTVSREWNDFPASPAFVPLTHELLRFVSADRQQRDAPKEAKPPKEEPILFVPDRMPLAPHVKEAPTHFGRWRQVYAEFEGRPQEAPADYMNHWVITQETITIWSGFGGLQDHGGWRYRLNNETTPVELDLTVVGGQQQRYPSILKLEGDRLTVCLQNIAERGRPKDFISRPGSGIGKFVYQRMKAPE